MYVCTFVPADYWNTLFSQTRSSLSDFDIAWQVCSSSIGCPRSGYYTRPEGQRAERTVAFAVVIIASTANASGAKPMTIAHTTATVQKLRLCSLLQGSGCLQDFLHHCLGRLCCGHAGTAGHGIQIGNVFIAVNFSFPS